MKTKILADFQIPSRSATRCLPARNKKIGYYNMRNVMAVASLMAESGERTTRNEDLLDQNGKPSEYEEQFHVVGYECRFISLLCLFHILKHTLY